MVGADIGDDAGAGGSDLKNTKRALSLVVALTGKPSKVADVHARGGAQVEYGALAKVGLWSRSSGDDEAPVKVEFCL